MLMQKAVSGKKDILWIMEAGLDYSEPVFLWFYTKISLKNNGLFTEKCLTNVHYYGIMYIVKQRYNVN